MKGSYHEFAKSMKDYEINNKETYSQEKFGKKYDELSKEEKQDADNNWEGGTVFHNTMFLEAATASIGAGNKPTATDLLALSDAANSGVGPKAPIYELITRGGMTEKAATQLVYYADAIVRYAHSEYSPNTVELRSDAGKRWINNLVEKIELEQVNEQLKQQLKDEFGYQEGTGEPSTAEKNILNKKLCHTPMMLSGK